MDMEKQTSDEREQYTRIRSIKLIATNYKYPSTPISLGILLRLLKIFSRKIRLLLSIRGLDSPGRIGDRLRETVEQRDSHDRFHDRAGMTKKKARSLVARSGQCEKFRNRDGVKEGKRGQGRDSKALGIYSKATSLRCGWQSRSHENSKDV